VYKAFHEMAPGYTTDLLSMKAESGYYLGSDDFGLLEIPKTINAKTFGERAFVHAAPLI
jgi:hypothetical protein